MALLCFLRHGHDHLSANSYQTVVKRALTFLLSSQTPLGYFGERNYEHAMATAALVVAFGMTKDAALQAPAQRAIDEILAHQNIHRLSYVDSDGRQNDAPDSRAGWDYADHSQRDDSSVSFWNIVALERGAAAGLQVGRGLAGAKAWLEATWQRQNPGCKAITAADESLFP